MKKCIVFADGFHPELFKELKESSLFDMPDVAKLESEELLRYSQKAHILVVRSRTKVTEDFLKNCPNLKWVIRAGEGLDNINKEACAKRGIEVFNTPGANGQSAAELAVGLIFSAFRKIARADSWLRAGVWETQKIVGHELSGKKLGIVGFGKIGKQVFKMLSGFSLDFYYFDPFAPSSEHFPGITRLASIEELFSTCHVVTLHVPAMESTKNLVTYELLKKMPKPSLLVNAARGGTIVEKDLLQALEEEVLTACALDVFEKEPLVFDKEETTRLLKRDNVVLTPHIGANTHEAQYRIGRMILDLLKNFESKGAK